MEKYKKIDINEKNDLSLYLDKIDLWKQNISENLTEIIKNQFNEFKLTVSQAYEFYELIGEEDKKILNIFKY